MTILRVDGFDMYDGTNSTALQRGWTGTVSNYNQPGRFTGSKCIGQAAGTFLVAPHGSSLSTVSVGAAWMAGILGNFSASISDMIVFSAAGVTIAKMGIDNNGKITIGRADYTTNKIADSGTFLLTTATWNYIEIEFTRSATVGVFKVYVNGTLVINATAANTGATNVDGTGISGANNLAFWDDFYLTDTGTKLGERRVEYLVPTADTAQKDWATSTGTVHFSLVNDIPANGDSNYVVDSVVGHKDTFGLADLSSTPSVIDLVQPVVVARKDDATARQIRNYNISGATTTSGTTQTMASGYLTFSDKYVTDPNTGAAWTASAVNALQLGIEVVT